jgi:hypothetical protein
MEKFLLIKVQKNAFFLYIFLNVATRLPIELVFVQECASRAEAIEAERKIKKWGKRKKNALVNKGWEGIIALRREYQKRIILIITSPFGSCGASIEANGREPLTNTTSIKDVILFPTLKKKE